MASTFESIFEFLFKYRPWVFEKGQFALTASWPLYLAGLALVVLAVPTLLRYRDVRGKSQPRNRWILTAIRVVVLAVVLFCLFRPVLVLSTVVPQRSFVGILLDDSRSMNIADREGLQRAQFINENFGPEGSSLLTALAEKFKVRFFEFSSTVERISDASELTFSGEQTHLGRVLERGADELSTVPLAGLVLVSDGADNSGVGLSDTLLSLQARHVPVYTVGLGRERYRRAISH